MTRPHGYARYRLDKCRCYTCAFACSEYNRNRERQIALGTWQPFVDAQPVRDHLAALGQAGIGYKRAAELAGINYSVVSVIIRGTGARPPSRRVRRETAERILAVEARPAALADKAIVTGPGTARRAQALTAIGWSLSEQSRRIGWTVGNYAEIAKGRPVTAATARLVADLYDQMSITVPTGPTANRVRQFAQRKGWAPPLAWDDDTIDDPATKHPYEVRESLEDFAARYRPLAGRGHSWAQIAAELDVTIDTAKKRVLRARAAGLLDTPQAVAA